MSRSIRHKQANNMYSAKMKTRIRGALRPGARGGASLDDELTMIWRPVHCSRVPSWWQQQCQWKSIRCWECQRYDNQQLLSTSASEDCRTVRPQLQSHRSLSTDQLNWQYLPHVYRPVWWPSVRDYLGEPVPERYNQSGFYWSKRQWVSVASAGLYASLHLAPDR